METDGENDGNVGHGEEIWIGMRVTAKFKFDRSTKGERT